MSKCRRIEEDVINPLVAGIVDAVNQFVFGVALQSLQVMACHHGLFCQGVNDAVEGDSAVDIRFPGFPISSGWVR